MWNRIGVAAASPFVNRDTLTWQTFSELARRDEGIVRRRGATGLSGVDSRHFPYLDLA